jgi:TRAP-type C4-dicarboxylate transport system permease small subunit
MIFLGAALVQAQDGHIAIDTLRRRVHGRAARLLDLLRRLAIGFAALVLIWQGTGLTRRTLGLEYPAMGISRAFLYGAVPVCFALLLINLIRSALSPAPRRDEHEERHA